MSQERAEAATALLTSIDAKRNLPLGIAAGAAGAILGALAWAAITATTHYQIGFMAIGVALLVGYGVSRFGSGRTKVFGYAGGALALLGSLLGNVLTIYAVALGHGVPFDRLLQLPPNEVGEIFTSNSGIMDLVFYGIAAYYGYHNSIRRLTKAEIAALPA